MLGDVSLGHDLYQHPPHKSSYAAGPAPFRTSSSSDIICIPSKLKGACPSEARR